MADKNPHAVALGRRGGLARAARLTPAQRSEAGRKAVLARWARGENSPLARSARATVQARTRDRCEVCGAFTGPTRGISNCKQCEQGR